MKFTWIVIFSISMFSVESSAWGQLIPRRNTTRPCPRHDIPPANYKVNDRSPSTALLSYRFVYLDDPLDVLNQPTNANLKESTEITTLTTEKTVANGASDSNTRNGTASRIGSEISAAMSAFDDARLLAREKLLKKSGAISTDISEAISSIDDARLLAQEKLLRSGKTSNDISDAISAVNDSRIAAQARLLNSITTSEDISVAIAAIDEARLLAQEKLLNSAKISTGVTAKEDAQLETQGKTINKTTKKTQVFENTPGQDQAAVQKDQKLFQWREDTIKIDHCSISNMAVQLSRDGAWILNLRADQNRNTANARFNPTLHIKRNEFGIVLRCYGNLASTPRTTGLRTGKPVLVEIEVETFWVQNGKPEFLVTSGDMDLIKKHFDSIDRVEIEFFYFK